MFKRLLIVVVWFVILLGSLVGATITCRMVSSGNDMQAIAGALGLFGILLFNVLYGYTAIKEVFRA